MWLTLFERIDAMVTWNDCEERRAECREDVDRSLAKVRECAAKKLDRGAVRWFVAILVPVLAAAIGCGITFAFRINERATKNEQMARANERDISRIHVQLDRIEEYAREAASK